MRDFERKMILAGDVGGTNSRFGCLEAKPQGGWEVHNYAKVSVSDYLTFDDALTDYINSLDDKPKRAAIAAAGPVNQGYVNLTNANWQISARQIEDLHGIEVCGLYNDFAGMTRSINELSDDDFKIIREGKPHPDKPILVAGPGTGFGVGYLMPTQAGLQVLSTEGGHVAYNPKTDIEVALLHRLKMDRDYVSLELVSSGIGLSTIHKAICEIHGQDYIFLEPKVIRERGRAGDMVCGDVCKVRANATMDAIGDFVLTGGARGGVVLAGGISQRMIDFYMHPDAMNRFLERGARSEYIRDIPVRLLKSPFAPLIGSAALLSDAA